MRCEVCGMRFKGDQSRTANILFAKDIEVLTMLLRFEDSGKVRITFLNELGDDASICEVTQHLYEYSDRCNLEVTNW